MRGTGAEVERNQVGLAVRQHGHRRAIVAEVAAVDQLGQCRLHRSVAAVDDQQLRPDQRDRAERVADLVGAHRQSVTTAMGDLARAGLVSRRESGAWVLHGPPPDVIRHHKLAAALGG